MEMKLLEDDFIPAKVEGKHLDVDHSVAAQSVGEAGLVYQSAALNLLRPYLWHDLAGIASAGFSIFEKDHHDPFVKKDDHLQVQLVSADDNNWVVVEDLKHNIVKEANESVGIKLRACSDPRKPENKISHFFTEHATTTIIIKRTGNVVTASYHGRNERPNIHNGNMIDNIRNGVIAFGAVIGLSQLQWDALIKGLLSQVK